MNPAENIYHPTPSLRVDVWAMLGVPERGESLYESLHGGLSYRVFEQLAQMTGLDKKTLTGVTGIPPATLQRRARAGRFSMEESDRLYRLAEILSAAIELFEEDLRQAQQWLGSSLHGLGGRRPLDMLQTSAETRAVLDLIGRLERGVFA